MPKVPGSYRPHGPLYAIPEEHSQHIGPGLGWLQPPPDDAREYPSRARKAVTVRFGDRHARVSLQASGIFQTTTGAQALAALSLAIQEGLQRPLQDRCLRETAAPLREIWDALASQAVANMRRGEVVPPANIDNRFADINAPLHTAVNHYGNKPGAFLHANFIEAGRGLRLIAAQKPTPSEANGTEEAFWLATREEKVGMVVDLTSASDNLDGDHYGPLVVGKSKESPLVKVDLKSVETLPFGEIQHLVVTDKRTNPPNQSDLKRLKFQDWPDHGVISPTQLIQLAEGIEKRKEVDQTLLVHCRAGVGRTGTLLGFIMAKAALRRLQMREGGKISPADFAETLAQVVLQGRRDRGPGFVQNQKQFALLANALMLEMGPALQPKIETRRQATNSPGDPHRILDKREGRVVDRHFLPMSAKEKHDAQELRAFMLAQRQRNLHSPVWQAQARAVDANFLQFRAAQEKPRGAAAMPAQHAGVHFGISKLWNRIGASLQNWTYRYLSVRFVENNGSGIPCVGDSAVAVNIGGQAHYVHANHIKFARTGAAPATPGVQPKSAAAAYVAGQAPRGFDACEKLLLHALEAKQGVFQIVSPQSHGSLCKDGVNMVAPPSELDPILKQLMQARQKPGPLILGGHYEVISLAQQSADANQTNYLLKVKSLWTGKEITVPLTQVGLRFDNALLRKDDLECAQKALNEHTATNDRFNGATPAAPVVISQSGIGRNAAVMVYDTMLKKIQSGEVKSVAALDAELEAMICAGRKARGPGFIHSAEQLQELRSTLALALEPAAPRAS